jgi:hypothetical protein
LKLSLSKSYSAVFGSDDYVNQTVLPMLEKHQALMMTDDYLEEGE